MNISKNIFFYTSLVNKRNEYQKKNKNVSIHLRKIERKTQWGREGVELPKEYSLHNS
jgi:hypothetical protein